MKKQINAKDRRKAESEKKKMRIQQAEKKRLEKEEYEQSEIQRIEAEERIKRHAEIVRDYMQINGGTYSEEEDIPVSPAKTAGISSVFTISKNQILLTTFGTGKALIPALIIDNGQIKDSDGNFVLGDEQGDFSKYIAVKGWFDKKTFVNYPSLRRNNDQILCRKNYEEIFFGKQFEDNIHIQLIYSILDIEKILSVHVNHIAYVLNNILGLNTVEKHDLVGSFGLNWKYEDFVAQKATKSLYKQFHQLMGSPKLQYYKNALSLYGTERENEISWFYYFSMIGMVRQAVAHGDIKRITALFTFDERFDQDFASSEIEIRKTARKYLFKLYSDRITSINDKFWGYANFDLDIFFRIYGADKSERNLIAHDYYKFLIIKDYKNEGISFKKMHFMIVAHYYNEYLDQSKDTGLVEAAMLHRIYRAIDFILFRYYRNHTEESAAFVRLLRTAQSEREKNFVYSAQIEKIWSQIDTFVDQCISLIIENMRQQKKDRYYASDIYEEIKPEGNTFCQLMYLITRFLDTKETNQLFTLLIGKLENISSLIEILKSQGLACDFQNGYSLFLESKEMAYQLRIINNFSKMTEKGMKHTPNQFLDAIKIIGTRGNCQNAQKYLETKVFNIDRGVSRRQNGSGFRNFISKNAIDTPTYEYLVRYCNCEKVRKLAQNKSIIRFVLGKLPMEEVDKQYRIIIGSSVECKDRVEALADLLVNISIEDFENVHQNDMTASNAQLKDKLMKRAYIRLYFQVLYQLLKNLINVNSRYFLAFHCVERDTPVYLQADENSLNIKDNFSYMTQVFLSRQEFSGEASRIISENLSHVSPYVIKMFRNCVVHLNVIRNSDSYITEVQETTSYFGLYHYLVQRYLLDCIENDKKMRRSHNSSDKYVYHQLKWVKKMNVYSKDFVKVICTPFAYNASRYNNLTIEKLFDRNQPQDDKNRSQVVQMGTSDRDRER